MANAKKKVVKKKLTAMAALLKYNKELREKELAKVRKTATKKTQAVSKKPKLTKTEKVVGRVAKAAGKVKEELLGKKYDTALAKRRKKKKANS